jgi:hypothetical protein
MTADWLTESAERILYAKRLLLISFPLLIFIFTIVMPMYYAKGGVNTFAKVIKPWSHLPVILLDAEYKVDFYLHLPPTTKHLDPRSPREKLTMQKMREEWPVLTNFPQNTIFISRKLHARELQKILKNYKLVEAEPTFIEKFFHTVDTNSPVAFIPMLS